MKNLTLTLLVCIFTIAVKATTITVSNNPNSPGQFTTLQGAIDSANNGDTILIAGSPNSYGNVTIIDKKLHLIGIGYRPNKNLPYQTFVRHIDIHKGCSGSTVEGIRMDYLYLRGEENNELSNITIKRSRVFVRFELRSYINNILIYNNILSILTKNSSYSNISHVTITNNIISNNGYINISKNSDNDGPIFIYNNLFIKNNGSAFSSLFKGIVTNNIFYGASPYSTNITFSSMSNNLSYNTSNDTFNTTGTNNGGNNLIGVDPGFVKDDNKTFNWIDDFNLNPNSPAIGAGTDGTDLGIYGGAYPWPEGGISGSGYMYAQEPRIPQVNNMHINNPSIPINGTLKVDVKGIINH